MKTRMLWRLQGLLAALPWVGSQPVLHPQVVRVRASRLVRACEPPLLPPPLIVGRLLRSVSWLGFVCLLAVGFVPRTARAQDEFTRYLTAAARLYKSLEYERALEQVLRAKKLASGIDQDVSVALHEGIILADLGKREESLVAFRTGLLLSPNAKLPFNVSPKMMRDFEEVRAGVRKELAPDLSTDRAEQQGSLRPPPEAEDPNRLKKADVLTVVMSHKPAIIRCVDQHRQREPTASGTLVMRWSIQMNGSTNDISCVSGAVCSTLLAECLTGLIQGWIFPAHSAKAQFVEIPFLF